MSERDSEGGSASVGARSMRWAGVIKLIAVTSNIIVAVAVIRR